MSPYDIPDGLHELAARIRSARAVATCLPDSIPNGMTKEQREISQHAWNLSNAVIDLLDLCIQDIDKLDQELSHIDTPPESA